MGVVVIDPVPNENLVAEGVVVGVVDAPAAGPNEKLEVGAGVLDTDMLDDWFVGVENEKVGGSVLLGVVVLTANGLEGAVLPLGAVPKVDVVDEGAAGVAAKLNFGVVAAGFDAVVLGANGLPGGLVGVVEGPLNENAGLVPFVAGGADGMVLNENFGTDVVVSADAGAPGALKPKAEAPTFTVFCSGVGPRAPFNEDEAADDAPKGLDIAVEVPFAAGFAAAAGFGNPKSNLVAADPVVPVVVVEAGKAEVAGAGAAVAGPVGLGVTLKLNVLGAGAGAAGLAGSAGVVAGATRESNELPELAVAGAPNNEDAVEGLTSVDAGVETGPNEKEGVVEGFSSFFAAAGAAGANEKEGTVGLMSFFSAAGAGAKEKDVDAIPFVVGTAPPRLNPGTLGAVEEAAPAVAPSG